jgi:hypothetical protein
VDLGRTTEPLASKRTPSKPIYSHWGNHESRLFYGLLVWAGVALLFAIWRRHSARTIDRWIVLWLSFGALVGARLFRGRVRDSDLLFLQPPVAGKVGVQGNGKQ